MWTAFFYSIRRIGMESPSGCMESVAKRRHGIARQRAFAFGLITYNTLCWFHTADKLRIPSTALPWLYIESYVEVLDFGGLFWFFRQKFKKLFCDNSLRTIWTWTLDNIEKAALNKKWGSSVLDMEVREMLWYHISLDRYAFAGIRRLFP